MKSMFRDIILVLISAVITAVTTWYITNITSRPLIEWYSRPYYKIDDVAIGNVFLTNSGYIPDKEITLTLDASIKDEDIKIVDLTSPYKILHNDNKTSIVIEEMKPDEAADITFKDVAERDDFEIVSFTSQYSNIKQLSFIYRPLWWHSDLWLTIVIWVLLFIFGLICSFFLVRSHKKRT